MEFGNEVVAAHTSALLPSPWRQRKRSGAMTRCLEFLCVASKRWVGMAKFCPNGGETSTIGLGDCL